MTRAGIIILALLAATTWARAQKADKQWCLNNGMIWSADNICLAIPPAVSSSGSTVTGSTSYVEPKTSHLIEYTGKMFRHDNMTATECDKLRVEIESKTSEHAECVQ
jgi:hypothetical protein